MINFFQGELVNCSCRCFTLTAILRYNADVKEPVMLVQACDLSSFGFFQRGRYIFLFLFVFYNYINIWVV